MSMPEDSDSPLGLIKQAGLLRSLDVVRRVFVQHHQRVLIKQAGLLRSLDLVRSTSAASASVAHQASGTASKSRQLVLRVLAQLLIKQAGLLRSLDPVQPPINIPTVWVNHQGTGRIYTGATSTQAPDDGRSE